MPWTDGSSVIVESIDLSPAGSLLATCSFYGQVRICESRYPPKFPLALILLTFREIHYHFLTAADSSSLFSFSFRL